MDVLVTRFHVYMKFCAVDDFVHVFHVFMNLFILIIFHIELCEIIFDYEINNSCKHEILA